MALIDYRLRITLNDGRQMTGQLLAFDTHMNLVLSNTEEFRRVKSKKRKTSRPNKKQKLSHGDTTEGARADADEDEDEGDDEPLPVQEQKRTLGLVILRGENVISISIEAPPPESKRDTASVCIYNLPSARSGPWTRSACQPRCRHAHGCASVRPTARYADRAAPGFCRSSAHGTAPWLWATPRLPSAWCTVKVPLFL